MASNVETLEIPDHADTARDAVEQTATVYDAQALLERWAQRDPSLYNYITQPWLSRACYELVRKVQRSNRAAIWTAPNYTQGGNGQRVLNHARTLLDFPLPNGIKLRDAKKGDLEEAAWFYREQSEDMDSKAKWLAAIAEKVGRKKVSSVFTAEQLAAMK